MHYRVEDFNGAKEFFARSGRRRWAELSEVLSGLRPQLQASDQSNKVGTPIFDPKGTNARLTSAAAAVGWDKIPVPYELQSFGKDWDSGKGSILAEWQFSNYPFLWNNIIRSEAVYHSRMVVPPLTSAVEALVVVTKTGSLPASNSTLYFEQAKAQIDTVTTLGVFEMPIRLVGLGIENGATDMVCDWNEYPARYGRAAAVTTRRTFHITRGRVGQYGNRSVTFD